MSKKNNTQSKTTSKVVSHRNRRLRYLLQVTLAVIAAIVIVALINRIVDMGFTSVSQSASPMTRYMRYDFTATRQYSLSPQTIKVLGNLDEDYEIVSVINPDSPQTVRVVDLLSEYALYGKHVKIRKINPTTDVTKVEKFYADLGNRYVENNKPIRATIKQGASALSQVADKFQPVRQELINAMDKTNLDSQPKLKNNINAAITSLESIQAQIKTSSENILKELDSPLPAFGSVHADLEKFFISIRDTKVAPLVQYFNKRIKDYATPDNVKNAMLRTNKLLNPLRSYITVEISKLQRVEPYKPYEDVRSSIQTTGFVAILASDQARIIPLKNMYRQLPDEVAQQNGEPQFGFIGEEQVTGSIISMNLKTPPLVVFVLTDGQKAIGKNGIYNQIASRLQLSNVQVKQWNALPDNSLSLLPKPAKDQKVVWVVNPFPMLNVTNPNYSKIVDARERVAKLLREHIKAGDSALVMTSIDFLQQISKLNPVEQYLFDQWGIQPQNDRLVLREEVINRETRPAVKFKLTNWGTSLDVTNPLQGMLGVVSLPSPIKLTEKDNVKHYTLMQLSSPRMWIHSDIKSGNDVLHAKFDPETAVQTSIVGVAAEGKFDKDSDKVQRIAVTSVADWGSDRITTNMDPSLSPQGIGGAEVYGAAYPANSDLFVNSIYWLTGHDDLIAASPRSQDIRRVGAMSESQMMAFRWILVVGLPLIVFSVGLTVWTVRRRD